MSINFVGNPILLEEEDFKEAAEHLRCEIPVIKAVVEIEAGGSTGFLISERPKILFESRIFNDFTNGQYLFTNPNLATTKWIRNYFGGEREYLRLEEAMRLNSSAALKSCSWGLFQILGANHNRVGFSTVEKYVEDVIHEGDYSHLMHFVDFVKNNRIDDELRNLDWHGFARVYNGPGYRKNNYARRLALAYEKYKSGNVITVINSGVRNIESLQKALNKHGANLVVDGIAGPATTKAVITFQNNNNNLIPDGIVGLDTWAALDK